MFILGLSAMGHDPAAALLGDSGIVAACEEGKLARSRSTEGIPRAAIEFCLERAGISWNDLDYAAIATRPMRAWSRQVTFRGRQALFAPASSTYFVNKAFGDLGRELNNLRILRRLAGGNRKRVVEFDHHLCHAASAYYASPYDDALIVSLDEQGDGRAGFVGTGEGPSIRKINSLPLPHSLAWVYTQITKLLGFRPHGEEHKTQWMSLCGDPVFEALFLGMLRREPQGPPHLNSKYFQRGFASDLSFTEEFYRRLGIKREPQPHLNDLLRADLATSLQKACGVVICDWLETLRTKTRKSSLCLAGGLFLNPLLVATVEAQTGFEQVFVQPAAGNEGTSLGAAWLALHQLLNRPRTNPMSSLYRGPVYSNEAIKQVLDNCKASYSWCDSEDRKIEEALRLLQAGKIVAWYQGAAEFGPRALGNRSLLASPWAPFVSENLNDFVKHRESFRPFALAIPEEDCEQYFHCSKNGRYMTTMAVAKDKARKLFESSAPGFVSNKYLVRLHVVSREDNPLFWKLLKRSGEKAPAPILVNTSFNLFGEPLVITPRDAVRSYFCSGTDALMAGSFLLTKR